MDQPTVTKPKPPWKDPDPQRTFTVLVIEDDPADRNATGRDLSEAWPFEHDLTVEFAANGAEAVEQMRTKRFTFIVVNWKPQINGAKVLHQIRQQGVHIPIIVFSKLPPEIIPADLAGFQATYLNQDTITPITFHEAIAQSLHLLLPRPNPPPTDQ